MPITYKVTQYFSQANFGWSETWWKTVSAYGDLRLPVATLMLRRANMLGTQVNTIGLRISEEGNQRSTRLYEPGASDWVKGGPVIIVPRTGNIVDADFGQGIVGFDQVRACLRYEVLSGTKRLAFRYLCGIPDAVSATESAVTRFTEPAFWWDFYQAWRDWLLANFLIKATRSGADTDFKDIDAWTRSDAAPGNLILQIASDFTPPLKKSNRIYVSQAKMKASGIRSPNGQWIVESVTPGVGTTVLVELRQSEIIDINYIKYLGKVRAVVKQFVPFSDLFPFRVGTHRRGGPFGQLRGRARSKLYVL